MLLKSTIHFQLVICFFFRNFSIGQGDGYVLSFDKNSYFGDAGWFVT